LAACQPQLCFLFDAGNMLDNVELINTLDETKTKASEVAEKLKMAAKTADEVEKNRDFYRPVAKRGAILFFILAEMATVNVMYQYALSAYLEVTVAFSLLFAWATVLTHSPGGARGWRIRIS